MAWPNDPLRLYGYVEETLRYAWDKLLSDVGYGRQGSGLNAKMQRWLKALGYYGGLIDGHLGPMSIKALQRFLRAKRLYDGLIDGSRGPMTVKAERRYLNGQAVNFY